MIGLVVTVSACASTGAGDPVDSTTTTSPGVSTSSMDLNQVPRETVPSPMDGVFVPESVLQAAIAAAVEDTGLADSALTVMTAVEVEWNDASLGCPSEGVAYAQVITGGYWVILEADGQLLDYRASLDSDFRHCPQGSNPFRILADR